MCLPCPVIQVGMPQKNLVPSVFFFLYNFFFLQGSSNSSSDYLACTRVFLPSLSFPFSCAMLLMAVCRKTGNTEHTSFLILSAVQVGRIGMMYHHLLKMFSHVLIAYPNTCTSGVFFSLTLFMCSWWDFCCCC